MFELTPFGRRNNVAYYNPFRELEEMEKDFWKGGTLSAFKTDIKDNGKEYILEADLPGFKKEDINIDISGGYLTIKAERHSEAEQKDKKGNYIHCERSYGSFSRSFDLAGVNEDEIKAAYSDGVLTLTLPKCEEENPKSRKLEIE